MYKRQLRFSGQHQIRTHLAELQGKKINIVLNDNQVIFGELLNVKPNSITVRNMRLKDIEIAVNTLYELYLDVDA